MRMGVRVPPGLPDLKECLMEYETTRAEELARTISGQSRKITQLLEENKKLRLMLRDYGNQIKYLDKQIRDLEAQVGCLTGQGPDSP